MTLLLLAATYTVNYTVSRKLNAVENLINKSRVLGDAMIYIFIIIIIIIYRH